MAKPVGKHILVKRIDNKPKSNLIVPENYQAPPEEADWVVQAVGNKCELGLSEGDKLIFRPEAIMMVPVKNEEDLFLVPESFVIAIESPKGSAPITEEDVTKAAKLLEES